jgi:hypothetical protein
MEYRWSNWEPIAERGFGKFANQSALYAFSPQRSMKPKNSNYGAHYF